MSRYRIIESVRSSVEEVHSYEDLEIHHPSRNAKGLITGKPGDFEKGRAHDKVNGEFEEVRKLPDGRELVKKDFVLLRSDGGPVHIPSPVDGFVHYVKGDRTAALRIYDRPFVEPEAKLLAQVLHMDPKTFTLKEGTHVSYGQGLGVMSDTGTPGSIHAHVEAELNQFRKYIRDLDQGVITPHGHLDGNTPHADQAGHDLRHANNAADVLKNGDNGQRVRDLQAALSSLGYRGLDGHSLKVDGDFGDRTEFAVKAFQHAHGLRADGKVGDDTRAALRDAETAPLLSERTHPDNALFLGAKRNMEQLPAGIFRSEGDLDQAAASVAVFAKRSGLAQIDHVVLNTRGDGFIAVQGDPQEPGRHLALVDRHTALSRSVQQSTNLLAQESSPHPQEQVRAQAEHMEHRAGLSIGMRQ